MYELDFEIAEECEYTGIRTLDINCEFEFEEVDLGVGPESVSDHIVIIDGSMQITWETNDVTDSIIQNSNMEYFMKEALKRAVKMCDDDELWPECC